MDTALTATRPKFINSGKIVGYSHTLIGRNWEKEMLLFLL
jgi:hypothetical protein